MAAILVVEDERVVAKDIEESLLKMGHEVIACAHSGSDCINEASKRCPDLVLMDIRIEGEMDGIDTAKVLRSRFDVPVIYLTAYVDSETVSRARETEPHGYILKPFRVGELRSAVDIALFKHSMERRLRDRERWFSTTLKAIGDAVIAVDRTGDVTFMNLAAELMLGRREEQVMGSKLSDVFKLIDESTRQPIDNPIRIALTEGKIGTLPARAALVSPSGERPIEDSVAPIVDDAGNLMGAVLVFRDVSEQRRLQEQISLADRLTSLGTLAAGVAHEINNPLTYVMVNSDVVCEQLGELRRKLTVAKSLEGPPLAEMATQVEDMEEAVREIQHGADRIRRIVNDLRVFARPDAEGTGGNVVASLEWALRVTESQTRHCARVVSELNPMPPVRGSDARLGQVFLNLLINAAQAIEPGKWDQNVIHVSTALDERGTVTITIRDSGKGIPADVVKRIFDPFFTTKPVGAGTGLGLSICRGIVETMGGEIRVESAPGEGTTFRIDLPSITVDPAQAARAASKDEVLKGRLLVIDDEALVASSLKRILAPPHDVVAVTSARDALRVLGGDRGFDLIFCDLMMPRTTGMDLYEEALTRWPDLAARFVFLSGGAFTVRAEDFLQSVSNERLDKPFDPPTIREFVQKFLEAHPR